MFFRHHNQSPDCESYIRWLFLFCNQNIAIVWLGRKSADGVVNIGRASGVSGVYGWSGVEMVVKTWRQILEQWVVCGGREGKGDAKSSRREEWLAQKGGRVILRSYVTKHPCLSSRTVGIVPVWIWIFHRVAAQDDEQKTAVRDDTSRTSCWGTPWRSIHDWAATK